jgi:hypothetical protein
MAAVSLWSSKMTKIPSKGTKKMEFKFIPGCFNGCKHLNPCWTKYRKTSDRSPRLLSVQFTATPGFYTGPGL